MTIAAAIQMTSSYDVKQNLQTAARLIEQAVKKNAKLIVLPENFALMGLHEQDKLAVKENFGAGVIQNFLAEQAKLHRIFLVGGTIPIARDNPAKVRAACLVFDDTGKCIARYDKIHLFDVIVGNQEQYQESNSIEPGQQITLLNSPAGKLGVAVCYDIRFPELFRQLFAKGAEIFVLPAAFTVPTGQAHWEILSRSRAIENFCYFIGACQSGTHANGRKTYGHSLIVDPWGKILASLPEGEGIITTEIDLNYLHELRKKMPIDKHRKLF